VTALAQCAAGKVRAGAPGFFESRTPTRSGVNDTSTQFVLVPL